MSDGLYNHGRLLAAFMTITEHTISGSTTIPGHKHDHSLYRGELGGILPAIIVINELCKKYNVKEGKCTIGVDNKGALASTFRWKRSKPRWVSYNIVGMIRYHLEKSPIIWEGRHVKGHQDDKVNKEDLDEWTLGNIEVDIEAREELGKFKTTDATRMTEGASWRLAMNDMPIAGNIKRTVMLGEKRQSEILISTYPPHWRPGARPDLL